MEGFSAFGKSVIVRCRKLTVQGGSRAVGCTPGRADVDGQNWVQRLLSHQAALGVQGRRERMWPLVLWSENSQDLAHRGLSAGR